MFIKHTWNYVPYSFLHENYGEKAVPKNTAVAMKPYSLAERFPYTVSQL